MKTNQNEMLHCACIGKNIALFWTGRIDFMPASVGGRE